MIIDNLLSKCLQSQELLELYTDSSDPERFSVGVVVHLTTDAYWLSTLDENGVWDSLYVGFRKNIHRIGIETRYLSLISSNQVSDARFENYKSADFEGLLPLLVERQAVVTLVDEQQTLTYARLLEFDSESFLFREFAKNGGVLGLEARFLSGLLRVHIGGPDELAIERLIHLREQSEPNESF